VSISNQQFLAAVTYTYNYAGTWIRNPTPEGVWYLGHLWTLALEEQFYLLWPFLFFLVSLRKLGRLSLLLIFIFPMIRISTYHLVPEWRGLLGMMLHTAFDSILIGCLFALYRERLNKHALANILLRASPSLLLVPLIFSPIATHFYGGAYTLTLGMSLDASSAGLFIVACHQEALPKYLENLLSYPILCWIGQLSYSLYLWQQLILSEYTTGFVTTFPISLFLCFAMACCSYYLVEMPILRMKRRFTRTHL